MPACGFNMFHRGAAKGPRRRSPRGASGLDDARPRAPSVDDRTAGRSVELLEGRVALVTGARAGSGGRSARTLAREGADVAFNYTRADAEAAALVEEIRAAGRRALPFKSRCWIGPGVQEMVRRSRRAGRQSTCSSTTPASARSCRWR